MVERVAALRRCWTEGESEFDGQWSRFRRSVVNPKPLQSPLPVGFGCSGPLGMRLAARHADAWLPIDGALSARGGVATAIDKFQAMVAEAGRDPATVPITMFVWGWAPGDPSAGKLAEYAQLGIERLVVGPPSMSRHDDDTTLARLDEFTSFIAAHTPA
jgi:alkanesulfonate monooxygenase SsuD/methylene tetrahydromethanopterin reductase-like flavin-dependent oxidoreductase (luciferase family)